MVTKKDLVIVALATFCLTTTLFLIIPTRSQDERYDPWADYDENGMVNIVDISAVAKSFGASGDPTKPVNITSHASKLVVAAYNVSIEPDRAWLSDPILVDGYTKVSICVSVQGTSDVYYHLTAVDDNGRSFLVDFKSSMAGSDTFAKTYDVMNRYVRVQITNYAIVLATAYVDVYLIA